MMNIRGFNKMGQLPILLEKQSHFSKTKFPMRLISRFGSIHWPARSADLSALDFWLWGFLKDRVYSSKPGTISDLKRNIEKEIAEITPDMLNRVMGNFKKRLNICIDNNGSHLKDILFHL